MYTIEVARAEHVPSLAEVERAAAQLFPAEVLPAHLREQVVPAEVLHRAMEEGWLWVALDAAGRPVGFAVARPEGEAVFLIELDVHLEHGRRGLGRALVDAVITRARSEGFAALVLTTFAQVPWNAPFYERMGFRRLCSPELSLPLLRELREDARKGLKERVAMRLDLEGRHQGGGAGPLLEGP